MNRKMTVCAVLSAIVVVMFVFSSFPVASMDGETDDTYILDSTKKVALIHTSDIHGKIERSGSCLGLETVSKTVSHYKENYVTFLFDTGDTFYENDLLIQSEKNPMPDIMRFMKYDAIVPGNHDFANGLDDLLALAERFGNDKMLAMNVSFKNGSKAGQNIFGNDGYKVIVRDGVKLGVFGLCSTDFLGDSSGNHLRIRPDMRESINITDPVSAAKTAVAELKKQNVDYIVALTHIGIKAGVPGTVTSDVLCSKVSGIDVCLDGHSHTVMDKGKPVKSGIKMVKSNTVISDPGRGLNNIGIVTMWGDSIHSTLQDRAFGSGDQSLIKYINSLKQSRNSYLAKSISSATADISSEGNKYRENAMGNLLADIVSDVCGTKLAIVESSSIRLGIDRGTIVIGDILDSEAFPNNLMSTVKITGSQMEDYLNKCLTNRAVPSVSGMHVEYDYSSKIVKSITIDGKKIESNKTYTVAGSEHSFRNYGFKINEYHDTFFHESVKWFGAQQSVSSAVEGRMVAI